MSVKRSLGEAEYSFRIEMPSTIKEGSIRRPGSIDLSLYNEGMVMDIDKIIALVRQHRAENPPLAPVQRKLVIAPSYAHFRNWCYKHGVNPRAHSYVYRPEHLHGYNNLTEALVVLGFPNGARGQDIRAMAEAMLERERAQLRAVPYTYHYRRYFVPDTEDFEDLGELLARAWSDIDYGYAAPDWVSIGDGVLLDHDALRKVVSDDVPADDGSLDMQKYFKEVASRILRE